jgi:hypothetical protein
MKKNIGSADKTLRLILVLIIFTLYFTGIIPGLLGIILSAFAVIFVLTLLVGTCPLYLPFGLSTLRKK